MGGCCGGKNFQEEKENTFKKDSDRDISKGPLKNRGCTDIICIILFIVHWFGFLFFIFLGMQDGNPRKLFMGRDYQGAYCGVEEQWNNGPNLKNAEVQTYMMNVSASIDSVAKQAICSEDVYKFLQTKANDAAETQWTNDDLEEYECACCKKPCSGCRAAVPEYRGTGLTSLISNKMAEYTQTAGAGLFDEGSLNGDAFATAFTDATKYFVKVCATSCNVGATASLTREFTYVPAPDTDFYKSWKFISSQSSDNSSESAGRLAGMFLGDFKFQALPIDHCPYDDPRYCVPFPGVEFSSLTDYYCTFSLSKAAVDAVGGIASNAMQSNAVSGFTADAMETFGEWIGTVEECVAGIMITAFLSFIIGLIFFVLARFLIGAIVYLSICFVFLMLVFGGFLCYVRSGQCSDQSLMESGQLTFDAATSTGSGLAQQAVNEGADFDLGSAISVEKLEGNGMSYRGAQTETITGKRCMEWEKAWNASGNLSDYDPSSNAEWDLKKNYCRNPEKDFYTIWCYVEDTSTDGVVVWETCLPIGILQAECIHGYEVTSDTARDALWVFAIIFWVMAALWILVVWCVFNRIRLAIEMNAIAAQFIYETPSIMSVPIFQVVVGLIWCVGWAFCATFLVSQVPQDRTPVASYATYAEAFGRYEGDEWKPGACIGSWPTGSVWKDDSDCGDDPDMPKCWKCYPPRFIFDYRFVYIWFSFLWNNAMMIAVGQTVIAGAVGIWFFTPHKQKGSTYKVGTAIWNVVRYHSGSCAFGSLLVASVQLARSILMYFEKQAQVQKNKVMEIILKCGQCLLWCLEKCIKFINKNAFIQVALVGTNFCSSAKTAFSLILRNFVRFGVVAALTYVTQLVAVTFITAAVTIAGYFILKAMHPTSNPVIPCILFIFMGYMVARLFMVAYVLAVDTSLQCFIIVEEMGGEPGNEEEQFVPKRAAPLLQKNAPDKPKIDKAGLVEQEKQVDSAGYTIDTV